MALASAVQRGPALGTAAVRWHRAPLSSLLLPLSAVYGAAVLARRALYDLGVRRSVWAGVPTISVGGLEAGGSGKTPLVAYLLRHLLQQGYHPGLLTRGFGRSASGLRVRARGQAANFADIGDEAAMLVACGLDVPIAACARRRQGAHALRGHACNVLVLDDGFAHRALRRHLDIVVLRAAEPFGNARLLPAGPLREPPSSLRRAQVVVLLHKGGPAAPYPPPWAAQLCPQALLVQAQHHCGALHDPQGHPQPSGGQRLFGVAGIAHPQHFRQSLLQTGAELCGFVARPDHHRYTANEAQALCQRAQALGATAVATTAKDAIKLAPLWPKSQQLWVLQNYIELGRGAAAFFRKLASALNT